MRAQLCASSCLTSAARLIHERDTGFHRVAPSAAAHRSRSAGYRSAGYRCENPRELQMFRHRSPHPSENATFRWGEYGNFICASCTVLRARRGPAPCSSRGTTQFFPPRTTHFRPSVVSARLRAHGIPQRDYFINPFASDVGERRTVADVNRAAKGSIVNTLTTVDVIGGRHFGAIVSH